MDGALIGAGVAWASRYMNLDCTGHAVLTTQFAGSRGHVGGEWLAQRFEIDDGSSELPRAMDGLFYGGLSAQGQARDTAQFEDGALGRDRHVAPDPLVVCLGELVGIVDSMAC